MTKILLNLFPRNDPLFDAVFNVSNRVDNIIGTFD